MTSALKLEVNSTIKEANISLEVRLVPKPALHKTDRPDIGAGWKARKQDFVMRACRGGATSERSLLSTKNLFVALSGLVVGRDSYL